MTKDQTPVTQQIATDGEGIQKHIDLAAAFSKPYEISDDDGNVVQLLHVLPPGYGVRTTDLSKFYPRPDRKTGSVLIREAESFVRYVRTHGVRGTTLYVDPVGGTIDAVLNAHRIEQPGWEDFSAMLQLQKTPEWLRWADANGKWQTQEQFAEFVNDSLPEFSTPSGAHMLEVAQSFEATTSADFQSGQRLDNGERRIVYKETITARAGQAGELTIPEGLMLGLRPFRGGKGFMVKARLRYRITNGHLNLMVKIERIEDVLDLAFAETCTAIEEQLAEGIDELLLVHGARR